MRRGETPRRAGILIPLFSIPSTASWGIGEIGDIEAMARWLRDAGHSVLQMLPINETSPVETSPYSALSAMAIDPQFISLRHVDDFHATGGEEGLDAALTERLARVRLFGRINYPEVRDLKQTVLRRCFAHFLERHWRQRSSRAAEMAAFIDDHRWWLDDYAIFRALHAHHGETAWMEWPAPLASREPAAIEDARARLADEILYRQYLQWIADTQWHAARRAAQGVALFGDLPFMVCTDSADVWARQDEFRMDASVGVPPDAFSATGQDWGLPVYRWDVIGHGGFAWLRERGRRNAELYDGYRIDHLVGFFRTYFRPKEEGPPAFVPAEEPDQIALGERVIATLRESGAYVIAEDLGVIPDFVRKSLRRLGVAGYKVFRWEREWHEPGQPFKDPREYEPLSVATSGTHDTEPLVTWWAQAGRDERDAVLAIPSIREALTPEDVAAALDGPDLGHAALAAMLAALYGSGSNLLLLPIQDVFGWNDRVNQPATVGDGNWTWRLQWPVDRLSTEPDAIAKALQLKTWTERYGRT